MRAREQTGFKSLHALCERAFEIDRAAHAVFRRIQGQLHYRNRGALFREFPRVGQSRRAIGAEIRFIQRVAPIETIANFRQRRQQFGQRTHGGGFSRTAMPHNQHAADGRGDDV
jgi:hypothetical protein